MNLLKFLQSSTIDSISRLDLQLVLRTYALITIILIFKIGNAQSSMSGAYTQQPPLIDGLLNDSIWNVAPRISNFTQRELSLGSPASERTEVAIAYDETFIYVGVWCYDNHPENIIALEMKRDFDYDLDDNFILIFDTYNDDRNGFMFVTNPNAARADVQIFNNGGAENEYWNAVWDVKTVRNSEGWFAEFIIPLYSLRYPAAKEIQEWGVNFERNIRHKREQVLWQGWGRNFGIKQVNKAGTLTNLKLKKDGGFVELKPYAIGGGELADENRAKGNAGGDFNYLISPTYRLNVTFNTDFAQVESDQQQVNLSRFPLFFPELREFFVEGADYFDMGFGGDRIVPFYTRRIGLDQNREAVPIIAGARVLGKEHNHTLGLMSIQTAESGDEPMNNYTVGSWRQDLGSQSVGGFMSANKFSQGRWHTTTSINGRFSTSKFLKKRNLDIGGAYIHSYNSDTAFDAKAFAYRAYLYYFNDKVTAVFTNQLSPEPFDAEIGLMRRRNFSETFALLGFKPRPKVDGAFGFVRQFEFIPLRLTYTTYADTKEIQTFQYSVQFLGFDTRKRDGFSASYTYKAEGLREDFNLGDSLLISDSTYWWGFYELNAYTFSGRRVSAKVNYGWGDFYSGKRDRLSMSLNWRMSRNFTLSGELINDRIELPNGKLNVQLYRSRLEYAMGPNAFGSVYGQWNNANEQFLLNYRLRLIPKIGTDFYLILNQDYRAWELERTTLLGKLIWRFIL